MCVKQMVHYKQRIKGNEVASEMNRSHGLTFSVIHDSLSFQKVNAHRFRIN